MKVKTPKGMRDFLPEEQIKREELISILKRIFRKYGFSPLETPAMEGEATLTTKGAGGSEVGKEIFKLKDRGDRKLGLRFDFTVPLARCFAQNQLAVPFKRYQVGNVWRQEFGNRDREFIQCDVDTVGSSSALADAEMLAIVQDFFDKAGLDVVIKVNSRKFLDKVLGEAGVPEKKRMPLILILDKLDKIGEKGVVAEARKMRVNARSVLGKLRGNTAEDVEQVLRYAQQLGVKDAKFVPTLARGLDYYTGVVFEVFLKSRPSKKSVCAGGRYDNLIGLFCDRKVPATGISFGISRVYDALKKKEKFKKKTVVEVYIIPIGTDFKVAGIAKRLRDAGINTDVALKDRSVVKNLDYANKKGVPYVAFVGERELKSGNIKLKKMESGKERLLSIEKVIEELK